MFTVELCRVEFMCGLFCCIVAFVDLCEYAAVCVMQVEGSDHWFGSPVELARFSAQGHARRMREQCCFPVCDASLWHSMGRLQSVREIAECAIAERVIAERATAECAIAECATAECVIARVCDCQSVRLQSV